MSMIPSRLFSTSPRPCDFSDDYSRFVAILRSNPYCEHIAHHLDTAEKYESLYALLTANAAWMQAKFAVLGSDTSYGDDLQLAIRHFTDPLPAERLTLLTRLHTARTVVGTRAVSYTDTQLQALVWLNRAREAQKAALLTGNIRSRILRMLIVCQALHEKQEDAGQFLPELMAEVESITTDTERSELLRKLAVLLDQMGDARATAFFDKVIDITCGLRDFARNPNEKRALALALIETKRFEQASIVIATFKKTEDYERQYSLREFSQALSRQQRFDEAEQVARAILKHGAPRLAASTTEKRFFIQALCTLAVESLGRSASILHEIRELIRSDASEHFSRVPFAITLAQLGRYDDAERLARELTSPEEEVRATLGVAVAIAPHDNQRALRLFSDAARLVHQIEYSRVLLTRLADLAVAWGKVSPHGPTDLFREVVVRVAELIHPGHMSHRHDIVKQLAENGYLEYAEEIARETPLLASRGNLLSTVALWLAKTGHSRAEAVFNDAHQMILENVNEGVAAKIWVRASRLLLQNHDDLRLKPIFQETKHYVNRVASPADHVAALLELAVPLAAVNPVSAQALFAEAKEVAYAVERNTTRDGLLRSISAALYKIGQIDEAQALWQTVSSIDAQAALLISFAMLAHQQGWFEQSRDFFARAYEAIGRIKDQVDYAESLSALASCLALVDDPDSERVFEEAYAALDMLQDDWDWTLANSTFVEALMRAGAHDDARRLMETSQLINELQSSIQNELITSLLEQGRRDEALREAYAIEDFQGRDRSLRKIAADLATSNEACQAFNLLMSTTPPLETYLEEVTSWLMTLMAVAPALRVAMFKNALQVAMWVQPGWQSLSDALS